MLDTLHEETNKSNVINMGRQGSLPSAESQNSNQDQLNNSLDQLLASTTELTTTPGSNVQLNNSLDSSASTAELTTSQGTSDQLNNSYEQIVQSGSEPSATEQLNNSMDRKELAAGVDETLPRKSREITRVSFHTDQLLPLDGESNMAPLLNNATEFKQTLPSLHQFYAKESKTLNTNVDNENSGELLNTDSPKFAKQDNDSPLRLNEVNLLQDIAPMEIDKNDHPKGLKDVNIQADKCKKASIGIALCFVEQDFCNGKTSKENTDSGSKCYDPDVDSVKRMKFETTEKNFQHQAFSKLNRNMLDTEESCSSTTLQDFKTRADLIPDSPKSTDTETKLGEEVETNSILGLSESVGAQQLEEEDDEEEEEEEDEEDVLCDAADQAWDSYIKRHNSIVVSIFQGMFKSTVSLVLLHSDQRSYVW